MPAIINKHDFFLGRMIMICFFSIFFQDSLEGKIYPDSLTMGLDTIESAADQVEFLKRKARETLRTNSEWAFEINKLSYDIARASGELALIAQTKSEKGILHSIINEFELAQGPIRESLSLYKEIGDSINIGYQYRNLGICYLQLEQVDSSILYFYESLAHLKIEGDKAKLFYGLTCLNIGKAFNYLGNSTAGHNYIDAAIDIFKDLKDTFNLASGYNGKALLLMNELDSTSLPIFNEAILLTKHLKDTFNMAIHLHNKALYILDFVGPQEALDTMEHAFAYYNIKRTQNRNLDAHFFLNFGKIYLELNQLDKAEYYLQKSLMTKDSSQSMFKPESGALLTLGLLYEKRGDYKKSLEYMHLYQEALDKSISLKNTNLINFYEKDLEYRETKKQKASLETQNLIKESELELRRRNNYLLFAVLFGLTVILLILVLFNRKLKGRQKSLERSKEEVEEKSHDLQVLNNSKENLISIIGHDLRGPLNNLDQILELIPNQGDLLTQESKDILSLSTNSIKEMQHLLNNLLVWAKTQKRNLSIELEATPLAGMVDQVLNLYSSSIEFNQLNIVQNLSDDVNIFVDPDTIEVVIRNLLNNSIKYSPKGGTVIIQGAKVHTKVFLSIEDECGGLPDTVIEEIFEKDSKQNIVSSYQIKRGLGLKLCQELLEANHSNWSYTPTAKGSLITIVFQGVDVPDVVIK